MTPELASQIARWTATLEGWCILRKANQLAELVLESDAQLIVEIGVFGGRSLLPMAGACAAKGSGFVVGIDPWSKSAALEAMDLSDANDRKNAEWWGGINLDAIRLLCVKAIEDGALWPWCCLLQGRSHDFAPLFGGKGWIDVLHIDGNHSVLASCRDVQQWLPRVRPGGIVVMDDIAWESTKPAQALLLQWCDAVDETVIGGASWRVYRKR